MRMQLLMVLVGLLAAALPLAVMTWLSWHHAANTAQAELRETAERALERADRSYQQALSALQAMQRGPLAPCSPEHTQLMQTRVVTTSSVDQISYFQQGRVRCTSWGRPVAVPAPAPGQPDHTTADGATLQLDLEPRAPYGRCMLSLRLGDYEALMDPFHFVDLIGTRDMRIAIATPDGRLIAQQSLPDQALLQSLLRDPRTGDDGTLLFASARSEAWLAIVTAPRTGMAGIFLQQAWVLVPISLLLGAAAMACTIALSRRRYSLKGELSHAIRRNELYVVYQPIIELETGICVGAEALVRWRRADGSEVRPDLFIPLAEASGLIGAITDEVIERVIVDMRDLLVGDRSAHIAINLAPEDMISGRALEVIAAKLAGTGIANQQIWLEATERGFMDIEKARAVISAARHSGHAVAIDDFGVGYSNLQYLQQLPLDALKIDKSFIDAIGTDSATSPVTGHIIDMAKTLGLFVVAEGVETEDQLAYLHSRQVEFAQGWLFAKALPREEFIAFHRRRQELYGAAREDMQNTQRQPGQ
jgi:sensor c-di-GMP phosphodiesterase-like protein